MPHFRRGRLHALRLAALILACAALAAACSGGDGGGSAAPAASPAPTATSAAAAAAAAAAPAASYDFPTGPAVLVAADYQPPENRVDSTGAYFPVNGKPTFVFFDAIW